MHSPMFFTRDLVLINILPRNNSIFVVEWIYRPAVLCCRVDVRQTRRVDPTGPDPTRPVSCQVHLDPSDAATTLDLAVVLHRLGRAEAARDLYVKVGAKESAISRVIRYAPMINISTVGVCTFRESPPIRQTSYRIKLLTGC